MLKGFLRLNFLFLCLFVFSAHAEYAFVKEKSTLSFTASTWLMSVRGTFSDWKVEGKTNGPNLTDLDFTVTVNTNSLNTENEKRDTHLRTEDFFWIEKFPSATFQSTKIEKKSDSLFHV